MILTLIERKVDRLGCAVCKELIPLEDGLILGEVPFHRECAEEWLDKFRDGIISKELD